MNSRGSRIARIALAAGAFVLACVLALQVPVDVPDANSPMEGNHAGMVNGAMTIGQTFVADRDGLSRVDVTLAVERALDSESFTFRISEVPWKGTREVSLPLREVPGGKLLDFRPGTSMQRWHRVEFEPFPDSAGKRFFFEFEGKSLDEPHSVGLLMFFHNEYPHGEAYMNGDPVNAHVMFRTYSRGRLIDLIGVLAERMTEEKPGLLGSGYTYGALGLLYALLAGSLVLVLRRAS